jgi:uncharacterized protein YjbJ (UPF0337 family)
VPARCIAGVDAAEHRSHEDDRRPATGTGRHGERGDDDEVNAGLQRVFMCRRRIPDHKLVVVSHRSSRKEETMGDRTQRVKGKVNEVAGRTKGRAGYETGSGKTEVKGNAQSLKGKAQKTAGKASSAAKKATR